MEKEIYTPMEKVLIEGVINLDSEIPETTDRKDFNNKCFLLLDYEME